MIFEESFRIAFIVLVQCKDLMIYFFYQTPYFEIYSMRCIYRTSFIDLLLFLTRSFWYFDVDQLFMTSNMSSSSSNGLSIDEKSPDPNYENHSWVILTLIASLLYELQVFLVAAIVLLLSQNLYREKSN